MSPTLFALAIEPFAEAIRMDPDIIDFKVSQITYKINLFADDFIWYLTDPSHSLVHLQYFLNAYGTVYGYTINIVKSEILPLTTFNYCNICQSPSMFKWAPTGIIYIGIVGGNDLKEKSFMN